MPISNLEGDVLKIPCYFGYLGVIRLNIPMHTMRSKCCPNIQSNVEKVKVASRRSWSRWRSSTSARMVLRRRWGWPRRIASSKWDKKQDKDKNKDKDKDWQRLTKEDREEQVRLRQKQRHWKKQGLEKRNKQRQRQIRGQRRKEKQRRRQKKEKDRERNKDIYRGSQLEDWWAQLRSSCSWSINVAFYRWRSSGRMLSTPCWWVLEIDLKFY